MKKRPTNGQFAAVFIAVIGFAVIWILTGAATVLAMPASSNPSQDAQPEHSDAYCLLCHSDPDRVWTLPSGETLSLYVDPTTLAHSVHGDTNPDGALACVDCHAEQSSFPHPTPNVQTIREFQIERFASCRTCHEKEYTSAQDSVHGEALRKGLLSAATCVDCHGSHDIQPPDEPRQNISLTCGKCHGVIFDQYRTSVHGAALFEESNPDVPTCIDCHGVHNITNPTTNEFRVDSPEICARCHADASLMDKYGITTNVFESYLTDFHGATVALFENDNPDVPTNKAVCFDCHGVHNILSPKDAGSQVIRENLLTTCQQCHPGATANFPDAWIGHYPPSPQTTPLLFGVNLFYALLIPGVLGVFALLVFTDVFRALRQRIFGKKESGKK